MAELVDEEFGPVILRLHRSSRGISMTFRPSGELQVTAPPRTPQRLIRWTIDNARTRLHQMRHEQSAQKQYVNGQAIGHNHRLVLVSSSMPIKSRDASQIVVAHQPDEPIDAPAVQSRIRSQVRKALRHEAETYLPARLRVLAERYGFQYRNVRLAHQQTRWGSCSAQGTISLNIALMQLSLELIDYVLIHELSHTRQLNHSKAFWNEVARCMPDYLQKRRVLKTHSPHL